MIAKGISILALTAILCSSAVAQSSSSPTLEEGIQVLARDIAEKLKASDINKIAVVDFTDLNGYQSAVGDFIAEELITNLFIVSSAEFDVVERRALARVLSEQKLTATGLFDSESIANVGKILGIEAIVTGTITYLGDDIKINARLIGVETARVFAAAAQKVPVDKTVEYLMQQSSSKVSSSSVGGPSGLQVQRHDTYFQNSFLRVEVKSISKSKDKKIVTLALLFRNIANEDVYIAMNSETHYCTTTLVDNAGNSIRPHQGGEGARGLPCLYYEGHKETPKNYTTLDGGTQTTVVLTFESDGEIEGNIFSFSAEMLRFKGEDWSQFSVGISNIEL